MSGAAAFVDRAAALARVQRMEEALQAVEKAARIAPNDPRAAAGLAQLNFETWRPAAALFEKAAHLAPQNFDLVRNHSLALAAEGDITAGVRKLEDALSAAPFWVDGHRTLAAMRVTGALDGAVDASYAAACGLSGAPLALWMSWFQQNATMKRWDGARRVLEGAKGAFPASRTLAMAALYLDSESGAGGDLNARFREFSALSDPGVDLCEIRYRLRQSEPEAAAAIAQRHVGRPEARAFWPYLSLCWRLTGDARALWLDGDPLYVATVDSGMSASELAALAAFLRGLHRMKAPYPEQSVRGGTQTDRQLLFHHDRRIQDLRARMTAAVRRHAAALPAMDSAHPLLSQRRDVVHFSGSWSVRLQDAGFHAPHTHVLGWLSSALYVSLPPDMGPAPAGHLSLGAPPPELGLPLAPCRRIDPKPGSLALFPSTMWHSTEPFSSGERLTVAFDIALERP